MRVRATVLREPTRPKWWGTAGAPRDLGLGFHAFLLTVKRDTGVANNQVWAFLLTVKRDTGGANNQVWAFLLTVKRDICGGTGERTTKKPSCS